MKNLRRTSVLYGPNYPKEGDSGKVLEFRTVAKAKRKAKVWGDGSEIVFYRDLPNGDWCTEVKSLVLRNGKFVKSI